MGTVPAADARRIGQHRLTMSARWLTAERGLDGFTVPQLCEAADVGLVEFRCYFQTKEDAVIGRHVGPASITATAKFLTGGDGFSNALGPHLLEDLIDLAVKRWDALEIDRQSAADFAAALRREPRLVDRIADRVAEWERFDARVIVHREDLATGDRRAEAASLILSRLVHASALEVLRDEASEPFAEILRRRVFAACDFFASQDAPRP